MRRAALRWTTYDGGGFGADTADDNETTGAGGRPSAGGAGCAPVDGTQPAEGSTLPDACGRETQGFRVGARRTALSRLDAARRQPLTGLRRRAFDIDRAA